MNIWQQRAGIFTLQGNAGLEYKLFLTHSETRPTPSGLPASALTTFSQPGHFSKKPMCQELSILYTVKQL